MEVARSVGLTLAQHVRAQVLHAVGHPAKLYPPSGLSCEKRGNLPVRLTLTKAGV